MSSHNRINGAWLELVDFSTCGHCGRTVEEPNAIGVAPTPGAWRHVKAEGRTLTARWPGEIVPVGADGYGCTGCTVYDELTGEMRYPQEHECERCGGDVGRELADAEPRICAFCETPAE